MATSIVGRPLRAVWLSPSMLKVMAILMAKVEAALTVPADLSAEVMRVTGGTTYYGAATPRCGGS